jgi:hypothetical protein
MPAKNVSSFQIIMFAVMGPTLGFDTKQRNSFLIKFGFLTIKARLSQYYSYVISMLYHKVTMDAEA